MMQLDLNRFTRNGAKNLGDGKFLFPKGDTSALEIEFAPGSFAGIGARADQYLCMDVTALSPRSAGLCWRFWESAKEDWDMNIKMGVLPGLKTRLALPFTELEAKTLFLARTPGKLKTVVHGRPVRLDRVCKFSITVDKTPEDLVLLFENVCILDSEPDYPLPEMKMVDSLGQKKGADWPGKTPSREAMIDALRKEAEDADETPLPQRSIYGGWTGKRFGEGTGFFGLEHDGRRWWLKDPQGYAFFSAGFDCVGLGGECNLTGITSLCEDLPAKTEPGWSERVWNGKNTENFNFFLHNVYEAFGENYFGTWADMIRRRLIRWGCNTVACWSDKNFIAREKLPYVVIGPGYPKTQTCIFRDFPDVFAPEFDAVAEEWAQFLVERKDDPCLIGYFMSNEPQWAFVDDINLAAHALQHGERLKTKEFIIGSLKEQYGEISALNEKWETAFADFSELYVPFAATDLCAQAQSDLMARTTEMVRRYIRIPAECARRADPNHLNLGIRYAWLSSPALAAGCEYTDVFSFNCYSMDPTELIEQFSTMTGKPVMIGEFHFGALDRGLDATGLRGVATQQDRAIAYRRYMHMAAAHPMCLGAHYFTLYDQAYLGRFDGENYQIGALDVCSHAYGEFVDGITQAHSEMYLVADGQMLPTTKTANETKAIAF